MGKTYSGAGGIHKMETDNMVLSLETILAIFITFITICKTVYNGGWMRTHG